MAGYLTDRSLTMKVTIFIEDSVDGMVKLDAIFFGGFTNTSPAHNLASALIKYSDTFGERLTEPVVRTLPIPPGQSVEDVLATAPPLILQQEPSL